MRIIIMMFFCSSLLCAQETKIVGNFSFKPSPYIINVVDTSRYTISYEIEYTPKPELTGNSRKALCVLQIGEKYSKFIDLNMLKKDSLEKEFTKKESVGLVEFNIARKFRPFYSAIVLKAPEHQIIYQNNVSSQVYTYQEKLPELDWKLINESKKILDYTCKKATIHYRGRDFTAWYTTEIPMNNGPYIFEGLPGLILEVFDSKNKYRFTAVGIDKKTAEIYMRNENSILKTSREKFRTVQKSYHDNPGAYHGKAFNEDGSPMVIKSKPLHYDPFELE